MYRKDVDYLGDGVYAWFDGFGIWLRANDLNDPSDQIYLEPSVLRSLVNFSKRMEAQNAVDPDKA